MLGLQGDSTPSKEILILEVITEATAKVVCFHTAASLSAASLSTLFDGLPLATAVAILAEAPPEQWETTFQFINSVSLGAETQVTEQARAKLLASTSGGDVSLSANELACVAYQSAALRRKAELDAVHELSQAAILLLRPCAHCGHLSHVHMCCALCKEVRFCDRECQKTHWRAGHRETCAGRAAVASAAAEAAAEPAQAELRSEWPRFWRVRTAKTLASSFPSAPGGAGVCRRVQPLPAAARACSSGVRR